MASDAGLPERYSTPQPLKDAFAARVRTALAEGASVLDVGAGREPAVPPAVRPVGVRYTGLDVSAEELAAAPAGAYQERVVADASERLAELEGRFDVVLSYHVLEHVKPVEAVFANAHAYLRPGGRMVSLLSGTFSAFALANRLLPERFGVALMEKLLGREPETVFRAHYDRCWHGALTKLLAPWSAYEIETFYVGARYFSFSRTLQRAYVAYEDWALRNDHRNLATHYLIDAVR